MPSNFIDFGDTPETPEPQKPPALPALQQPVPKVPSPPPTPQLPAAPAAAPPRPVSYRAFGDAATTRQHVFNSALAAAQGFEPVSNSLYTLSLHDVDWMDPENVTKRERKKALIEGGSLARRMKGVWRMTDNTTGEVVSERRQVLGRVPYLSDNGAAVNNGSNYTIKHQLRLRPGMFARRKANGELEGHVNVIPGKGKTHRVNMDPKTGIFQINIDQANIPIYPLLRAMGVPDVQMRDAWGSQLWSDNAAKNDTGAIPKLYGKVVRKGQETDGQTQAKAVAEAFGKMEMDDDVTSRTLGKPHKFVTPEAYLDLTKKLLGIHKGEIDPDDRDAPAYQMIVGPEDLFAERIKRAGKMAKQVLWKATGRRNLDRMPSSFFDDAIKSVLVSSGLAAPAEEINPAELLDAQSSVTRMGVGGISSMDAVNDEMRALKPGYMGLIDSLRTPESSAVGVDLRLARGAMKGSDGKLYSKLKNLKTGAEEIQSAQQMADGVIAFPNEMETNEPVVSALVNGQVKMVPREQVTHALPHMEESFSHLGNMIPLKSMVKGQRAVMASRMTTQALPLVGAEAPFMQSGLPGSWEKSYEQEFGKHMGAMRAKQGGKVLDVTPDGIHVEYADGTRDEIELDNHMPSNRKTFNHQTPLVKPGDAFEPDQLLAHSNYTDKEGTTALGTNLRAAYIPYEGHNFEDAVVISESAAREKLRSQHMYQHTLDLEDGVKPDRQAFVSSFAKRYTKDQLANFDDVGVIKPGTKVSHGDPLVLAVGRRDPSKASLHGGKKSAYTDKSVTWDHHDGGVVTDVFMGKHGVNVIVKAESPMQVGDKLCVDEETEILTRDGWKPAADVTVYDDVCVLEGGVRVNYVRPQSTHRYETGGRMYRIRSQQVDHFVTAGHRMYVKRRGAAAFTLDRAEDIAGRRVRYKKNGHWRGRSPREVVLTGPTVRAGRGGRGTRKLPDVTLSVRTYLTLVGAFVSEGNLVDQPSSSNFGIDICQIKEPNRQDLLTELQRLGIKFCEHGCGTKIRIYSKAMLNHFRLLGASASEKRLPAAVFGWAKRDLQILFRWLMWGDGHAVIRPICYTTTSPGLAGDVQRLCLHIGLAANVVNDVPAKVCRIKGVDYNCQPRYSVRIVNSKLTPQVNHGHVKQQNTQQEFFVENYDRPVFCLTVPEHVFYVRRNGKASWTGNSGRYGDKGVVSKIIPDHEMPHDANGKPYHILLNPLGMISRVNAAQIVEAALGKVAEQTGKPYRVPDFDDHQDMARFAQEQLAMHGLADTEAVTDPRTGRKIKAILTGNRFFMKLHHQAEGKQQARGLGGYSAEGTPLKGSGENAGAKRIGMLELNALLSHGATSVINDAKQVRGQANPQMWLQYMSGYNLPTAKVPETWRKFTHQLRGAGINIVRKGDRQHIMAMTPKDVDEWTGDREVTSGDTVDWKTMEPVKGGLFDQSLTGGAGGDRWSHIKLHEPMLSPVMEDPARRLLGMTEKKFRAVMAGEEKLNEGTGPSAIAAALSSINVPREMERAKADIASGRKTLRDSAVRKYKILQGIDKTGIHPKDWMMDKVPVIPPRFRPVSAMSGGVPLVDDANYLYKEMLEANTVLKEMSGQLGDKDLAAARMALYDSYKAVAGLGEPSHPKLQEKGVKGLLKKIFSTSPKFGCFDDQTEIETDKGWMKFEHLPADAVVKTLNPHTGEVSFEPILERHEYPFRGEMFLTSFSGGSFCVTPSHRNWVQETIDDPAAAGAWRFEDAYRTAARYGSYRVRSEGQDGTPEYITVDATTTVAVPYIGKVYCVSTSHGVVYVRRHGRPIWSGNSVQRKLLGGTVDLVGRAVITPNPDLDMDEVGLPEDSAWSLYKPFVVRNLVRRGMDRLTAAEAVKNRSPRAREMLLQEMEERPVIVNRAPTLHRFGFMGARPRLMKGNTLHVSPMTVKGFNADFDGDAMQFHVPMSADAVKEVYEKMLPSKNLKAVGDFKTAHRPSQEYVGGLYEATVQRDEKKPVRTFATTADAIRAYHQGEIELDQRVEVLDR